MSTTDWENTKHSLRGIQIHLEKEIENLQHHANQIRKLGTQRNSYQKEKDPSNTLDSHIAVSENLREHIDLSLRNAKNLLGTSFTRDAASSAQYNRFRGIFAALQHDFDNSCQQIDDALKYQKLFEGAKIGKSSNVMDHDEEALLQENRGLDNSLQMIATTIQQARETFSSIRSQNQAMKYIQERGHHIAERLPAIGNVIGRIRRLALREQIILATVIALCILLSFAYVTATH